MKKILIITILVTLSTLIYGFACIDSKSRMNGTWVSTEDSRSIIIFEGDDLTFDYLDIKDVEATYTYKISENELIAIKGIDTLKYSIVNITEKELELLYIPRGQICKYIKK